MAGKKKGTRASIGNGGQGLGSRNHPLGPPPKMDHKPRKMEAIPDEDLFRDPPPREDCPLCLLPMPAEEGQDLNRYNSCCGKVVCRGCEWELKRSGSRSVANVCPFCREPSRVTLKESRKRIVKRAALNDPIALMKVGHAFDPDTGPDSYEETDPTSAMELYHMAAELGSAVAYYKLGAKYAEGGSAGMNTKRMVYYYSKAAMMGYTKARYELGCYERYVEQNLLRAKKHWMIAAGFGNDQALRGIQSLYSTVEGLVTKGEFERALRDCHEVKSDEKSESRQKAAETQLWKVPRKNDGK